MGFGDIIHFYEFGSPRAAPISVTSLKHLLFQPFIFSLPLFLIFFNFYFLLRFYLIFKTLGEPKRPNTLDTELL